MRVIIRRPHAYFFLDDIFTDRGGIRGSNPQGCQLADGSLAPLPGIYFLDERGAHIVHDDLASVEDLLLVMAAVKSD